MVVVFVGLWLLALIVARGGRGQKSEVTSQELEVRSKEAEGRSQKSEVSGLAPAVSPPTSDLRPLIPVRWLLLALAWLVCIEAANAVWFGIRDRRSVTNPAWSIRWPTAAMGYRETPLSKIELGMLRYDSARNVAWQDEVGNQWALIALRWAPGNQNSFIGRGHTPDVCFVGAGWQLRSEPAPVRLTVHGLYLPFRRYIFEVNGSTAYVFLALWDERSPGGHQELPLAYGIGSRLQSVLQGKRHQGLKKLEISLIGPAASEEALKVLEQQLQTLIVLDKSM